MAWPLAARLLGGSFLRKKAAVTVGSSTARKAALRQAALGSAAMSVGSNVVPGILAMGAMGDAGDKIQDGMDYLLYFIFSIFVMLFMGGLLFVVVKSA